MQNKFRVSGALFENTRGTGPAYTGFVEIDGQKHYIALWPKTSNAGNDYFQVSEDKKKAQQAAGAASAPQRPGGFKPPQRPQGGPVRPTARPADDLDSDDIPFAPEL